MVMIQSVAEVSMCDADVYVVECSEVEMRETRMAPTFPITPVTTDEMRPKPLKAFT